MSRRNLFGLAVAAIALTAALTSGGKTLAAGTGVKAEIADQMTAAEDKLNQLADAIPEDKYGWAPSKEVRSVREVFMHVAAANYGIPSFFGVKAPAGFDFNTYEKSLTSKTDVKKALKDSFTYMKAGFAKMSDADMDKPVEMFGMKTTQRGAYLVVMSHGHEHLGQMIAYARSIGVTPPWTAAENAAEAEATKNKKK